MEEPLSPRQFLHRHSLPQLVRIQDAHLHQLHTSADDEADAISVTSQTRATSSLLSSSFPHHDYHKNNNNDKEDCHHHYQSHHTHHSHTYRQHHHHQKRHNSHHYHHQSHQDSNCRTSKALNLDQPFLLYKAYSSRQIIGYILQSRSGGGGYPTDKRGPSLTKCGPTLLIPENYTGWFSLVTRSGKTAGYFTRIEEVADAQVPYFVTRGLITCYRLKREEEETRNGQNQLSDHRTGCGPYIESTINGGTLLRYLGLYEDISPLVAGLKGKHKFKSWTKSAGKSIVYQPGPRYAKCLAFNSELTSSSTSFHKEGEMVFIGINQTGRFYVVSTSKRICSTSPSYNQIYSIGSLMKRIKLPATVQLIIGPKPRNYHSPCMTSNVDNFQSNEMSGVKSQQQKQQHLQQFHQNDETTFSALLRLEEIRVRDVILACTLKTQEGLENGNFNGGRHKKGSFSSSIRKTWRGSSSKRSSSSKFSSNLENGFAHLTGGHPTLLEFDLDSNFTFVRTFLDGSLSSRTIPELVLERIAFCQLESDSWRRQIKVSHDITPKDPPGRSKVIPCGKLVNENDDDDDDDDGHHGGNFAYQFNKTASIGSRASSNISNVSRISRILQKLWNPSKKASGHHHLKESDYHLDNISEEEKSKGGGTLTGSTSGSKRRVMKGRVSSSTLKVDHNGHHLYESIKKTGLSSSHCLKNVDLLF